MTDELETIDDLNFTPLTEAGAKGKPEPREPLPQMQVWENCTILSITPFDPKFNDGPNPCTKRLRLNIDTHGQHSEIVHHYFNWWEGQNPNEKSGWHQVNCAIWPNEADRIGKTPADMIGEQVTIQTVPADKDPSKTKVVLKPAG